MADDLEALIIALRLQAETQEAQKNIDSATASLDRLDGAAKRAKKSVATVGDSDGIPPKAPAQADKLSNSLNNVEKSAVKAGGGLLSMKNIARTALGTFEAMAIFFVTQFVGQAIKKTIDSLMQLEQAFYRIGIAEKQLSMQGIEITPQDLEDMAKNISNQFSFVSKVDSLRLVSQIALLGKDLNLTKKQMDDLAKSAVALSMRTGESIENVVGQLVNGVSTSGRGLKDLFIPVDAAIIKQEALDSKLVESEEAWNNLTAAQRQQIEVAAILNIITKNTAEELENQAGWMGTVAQKSATMAGEWENLTTEGGKLFGGSIKSGIDILITGIQVLRLAVFGAQVVYVAFMSTVVAGFTAIRGVVSGNVKDVREFSELFLQAMREARVAIVGAMQPTLPTDTATGVAAPPSGGGVGDLPVEDLAGALEKMNQEILEAQVKLAQDMEDAAIDLGRKLLDIDAEYAKKRGDAQRDYAKKVRDINLDYNKKVQEINASASESRQKAQNNALEKEADFQNKMKELQENFLMSLEDALHSRDARQVLKLTKQYELDKLQAERKHTLDMSSSAQDEAIRQKKFVADRQAAERDRQFKLAEAQRNYADKLADLKREESAERAAAKLANQRKIEDLQKANRDRMAIIAANLVNEFNLTKKGLDAILKLFRVYYGNGGYIQQVMAGMQTMLNTGATSQKATSTSFYKPTSRTAGGFAEGGTVIANRPTKAIFGEAGLEMATFTPIGRKGQDVNKIFTSMSGVPSGNSGGAVSIELLLSPDLEARVVSNTLDKTADIIAKIKRSK